MSKITFGQLLALIGILFAFGFFVTLAIAKWEIQKKLKARKEAAQASRPPSPPRDPPL